MTRLCFHRVLLLPFALHAAVGCGSDDGGSSDPANATGGVGAGSGGFSAGTGGQVVSGSGGEGARGGNGTGGDPGVTGGSAGTNGAGTGGSAPATGGTGPATGGSGAGGHAGSGAGGAVSVPPGAVCANDSNCSQSAGAAVCCVIPGCTGPCECRLKANCPTTAPFLECNSAADCAAYGGGKICCRASSSGQVMQYCTKQSGCPGTTLP